MNLDGHVSSFTTHLYSSPPLTEGDLFALLAVGRSMEEMTAPGADTRGLLEKEIVEGLKATAFSGLLSSTLTSTLNLDEVYYGTLFDRSTGVSRSFLRLGKYLGKNMFFAYEGTLSNEDQKTYIFEYRLPKGFRVNLEVEKPRERIRGGVSYDWQF